MDSDSPLPARRHHRYESLEELLNKDKPGALPAPGSNFNYLQKSSHVSCFAFLKTLFCCCLAQKRLPSNSPSPPHEEEDFMYLPPPSPHF